MQGYFLFQSGIYPFYYSTPYQYKWHEIIMESSQAKDHDLHESNLLHVLKELIEQAEEIKENNASLQSTILQLQDECEGLRQKLEQEKNKAQVQNATQTNLINSLKNRIKALKQQLKSVGYGLINFLSFF